MNVQPRNRSNIWVHAIGASTVCASAVLAQLAGPSAPDLRWSTIDSGGGTRMLAETLSFTVQMIGTVGQPDAHAPGAMQGGDFAFAPGFWHDSTLAPVPCPGDVAPAPSGNGFVDVDDLISVILSWGQVDGAGDADGSGMVDVDDLIMVILKWGACPA